MILSDQEIEDYIKAGTVGLEPFDARRLQPTSVDLTLDRMIRVPSRLDPALYETPLTRIDMAAVPEDHTVACVINEETGLTLSPGSFILGSTRERVRLPNFLAARVEGKSSVGRLGLAIHVTAGFIDPGFDGNVTLEIVNFSPWDLVLHAGMPIGQICFMTCTPPRKDYSATGHYMGQRGPTESRYKIT